MKISVIIPTYNRAHVIGETIENMLRQSRRPYEVIVVDDGSFDNSVDVIRKFGDGVALIQQEHKGPGAARNAGLKVASGDFIQFMDSDDLASLNKLESQAKVSEEEGADIVYGPLVKAWIGGDCFKIQDVVLNQKKLPSDRPPLLWFLTSWSITLQQCLIRRSLVDRIGLFREDMLMYEDGDLFVRMLLAGAKLTYEQETLTIYRLDVSAKLTTSMSTIDKKIMDKARFYVAVAQLLRERPECKHYLYHPEFRFNIWKAFSELSGLKKNSDNDLVTQLESLAGSPSSSPKMFLRDWIVCKSKGLQKRLIGHRWPRCYQAGPLTLSQRELIGELGFKSTE